MTEVLVASVLVLWFVVIVLAFVVFALARQIGVLHERVAPAGALMPGSGPKVGELAPQLEIADLHGEQVVVGGAADAAQMILFVSPTCPICKSLVPTAKALARSEKGRLRLVFASDGGEPERHLAYVDDMGIAGQYPYVVSLELGMKFEVGKLPFAVLIGADGVLRSKGLVNSREHLESLVESMDTGYVSIQDYMFGEEGAAPESAAGDAVVEVTPDTSDLAKKEAS